MSNTHCICLLRIFLLDRVQGPCSLNMCMKHCGEGSSYRSWTCCVPTTKETRAIMTCTRIAAKATLRNWLIGCYFVEYEQKGYNRGKYGDRLLRQLVERVNTKGLKETLFRNSKTFYQPYSQVSALFKKSTTASHKLMAEISPTPSD